jgi:glycerol uptake facilitator-like aquaporin
MSRQASVRNKAAPSTRAEADLPILSVPIARPLAGRALAELVGTAFLLATVVGSGIMGERLSSGNVAVALLANSIVTGAGLVALIPAFAPVSGAHLNPAVTLTEAWRRALPWRDVPAYIACQVTGGRTSAVCLSTEIMGNL